MATGPVQSTKRDRLTPDDEEKKKPSQRRFGQVAPNNEKPYEPDPDHPIDQVIRAASQPSVPILGPIAQGTAQLFGQERVDQAAKNTASGLLQIPTDVGAMVDLARIGIPAAITSIPDDPERDDESYTDRLSEAFMSGIIDEQSQEELADDMAQQVTAYKQADPDATDDEVLRFLDAYQDTDEFFEKMTSKMSPGLRLAQYGNQWANALVNLNKRPDEQTIVDDLEQIAGQSILGIPKSIQKALGGHIRDKVGKQVAESAAGRVTARAAELATPVTMPYTPANVAANTVAGTGLVEATRLVANQPSILRNAEEALAESDIPEINDETIAETPELAELTQEDAETLPLEGVEPADGHGFNLNDQTDRNITAGGVTLASFFALPAFRRAMSGRAAQQAQRAIDQSGLNAGPTLEEQSDALSPMLSPTAGATDIQAPIRRGANQYELSPQFQQYVTKGQMLDAMDAQLSTASPPNARDSFVNAVNFGNLSNHPDTVPLDTIRRAVGTLSPEDRDLFAKYSIAKQRQQDYNVQRLTLDQRLQKAQTNLRAANVRGDNRAKANAQREIAELQQKIRNVEADEPSTRTSMQDWSRVEVDEIVTAAERNANVMGVADMYRRSGHDMLNYRVKNGHLTSAEATTLAANRDYYVPLQERAYPNTENRAARKALLFKDRVFRRNETDADSAAAAVRNIDERDFGKVNRPQDPIAALYNAWGQTIRAVTANNARRQVIDTLRMFDGAEGSMFRQFEYNGHGSFSVEEFNNVNSGLRQAVEGHDQPLTRVVRDGRYEFYEFSDPSMTRALEFAPLAAIPVLNSTRKMWQAFTTGPFAPWFSVKSALWDPNIARMTVKQGRSLGFPDTYARRLFNENARVNAVMDKVPDPLGAFAMMSSASRVPYALSMRAARTVGRKIADDLALNNGVFHALAQLPGGQRFIEDVGTNMSKMFDRSVFNVYNRNLSTHMGLLQENTRVIDDYLTAESRGNFASESAKNVWRSWRATIESIQGSTRLAFFAENYGRLKNKYGGEVPEGELKALVKDTRDLTSDMSKYSGWKPVQQAASAVPYLNPVIQGTRHIFGAMVPPSGAKAINKATRGKANMVEERTDRFWPQFVGGLVLPVTGIYASMQDWSGALEWWETQPEWRQQSGVMIPTGEALSERITNGEWGEFTPDKVQVLEIAPELSIVLNPVLAGLRQMGLVPSTKTVRERGLLEEAGVSLRTMGDFATAPIVNLFGAATGNRIDLSAGSVEEQRMLPHGGANADMMTFNSDVPQQVYDIVGALTSSSGQLIAQTFNVFDINEEHTDDFSKAFSQAFDHFKYETQRRVPDLPLVWNTDQREYSFTPESEYVYETERKLEPLIGSGRQQSVETDSKNRMGMAMSQGLETANKINDPLLKELTEYVYGKLRRKGTYKGASEEYTNLRVMLSDLEATRWRLPAEQYHEQRNDYVKQQQQLKKVQAQELQRVEEEISTAYGPVFEELYGEQFSFETLADLVRQNVSE